MQSSLLWNNSATTGIMFIEARIRFAFWKLVAIRKWVKPTPATILIAVPNSRTDGISRVRSAWQLLAQSPIRIQIIERPISVDAETSMKNKLYNQGKRWEANANSNSITTLMAKPAQAMRFRCLDRKRLETVRLTIIDTNVLHIVKEGSDWILR